MSKCQSPEVLEQISLTGTRTYMCTALYDNLEENLPGFSLAAGSTRFLYPQRPG